MSTATFLKFLHWLLEIRLVMLKRVVFVKIYLEYHAVGSS